MMGFDEFLLFVPVSEQDIAAKYKKDFFPMFDYGKPVPVATLGFNIYFEDEDEKGNPIEPRMSEHSKELVKFFKPLCAWIGTKENRKLFNGDFPNITTEPYSFFGDSGFVPVATVPLAMSNWFELPENKEAIEELRKKYDV